MIEKAAIKTVSATLEYVLALFAILECNSVYRSVFDRPDTVYQFELAMIAVGVLLIAALTLEDKTRIKAICDSAALLFPLMVFVVFFLIFNVLKTDATANYVLNFMALFPMMVVLFKIYWQTDSSARLLYVMSDIITLLAVLSLISWLLVVIGALHPSGTITIDWGGVRERSNWFNLLFDAQYSAIPVIGTHAMRNTGIFTESPMYNIFLNLAFFTELFLKKKNSWLRISILTITVFSTFGTLGIILNIIGWGIKVLQPLAKRKNLAIIIIVTLAVAIIVAILILDKRDVGSGSYRVHIDDFFACLKAWTHNWLIGCGYENETYIQQFMSEWRLNNLGLSNSIGPVLAEGGILLTTFYLLPFVCIIYSGIRSRHMDMAWFAVLVFGIFVVTIFHYRFFAIILLAFGYSFLSIKLAGEKIKLTCVADESRIKAIREDSKKSKLVIYVFTAAMILAILLCALSQDFYNFALEIYNNYSLALEQSQWKFVFGVCVIIFILSAITQVKDFLKRNLK